MKLKTISLIVILSLALTACQTAVKQPTTIPEEMFKTYVAGTVTAVAAQAQQTMAAVPTETATEGPTNTPAPTLTPTKEIIKITINGNTNCRKGATTYFPVVTTLPKGTEVIVMGVNKAEDYLYVQNPDDPANGCWIMTQFGTLSGNIESLPRITPPPTPMPTFTPTPPPVPVYTVSYAGLTACGTGFAANFKIVNTGALTMQSIRIRNTVAGSATVLQHTSNNFTQWSGGAEYLSQADLVKGEEAIVSTCNPGEFTDDPTNKNVSAEITICTLNDLKGVCTTQSLTYIPH